MHLLVVENNVRFPYLCDGNAYLLNAAEQLWVPRQHDVCPRLFHSITTSTTFTRPDILN